MVDVGYSRTLGGANVLDSALASLRCEDALSIGIMADRLQILEDKKNRYFGGRDQAHQVEVEIGVAGCENIVVVIKLSKGSVLIVLPNASAHGGSFSGPLVRKRYGRLQTHVPVNRSEVNSFVANLCRNERGPSVSHFVADL